MKANVTAATRQLCGSIFTSPARTLGSKQRESSMTETEESAMKDENSFTSNFTSDADTEAEPIEADPKSGDSPAKCHE